MKYTPAPWEIRHNAFGIHGIVSTVNECVVLERISVKSDQDEANARLISASPELLEALKTLLSLHDAQVFVKRPWEETFEEVRQLIAKAEGA